MLGDPIPNSALMEQAVREISEGPIKPITDIQFIFKNIVQPWYELTSSQSLPSNYPLIKKLIEKYDLPSADKYLTQRQRSDYLKDQWALIGHVTHDNLTDNSIEGIGGVLGVQGPNCLYSLDGLRIELLEAIKGHKLNTSMHIFLAPVDMVYNYEPQLYYPHKEFPILPLAQFNAKLTSKDLPEDFVQYADNGSYKDQRDVLFQKTGILPLDWRIGVVKR